MKNINYAERDQLGKVVFYVPLWKRKGISLELFDDYWRNVHGPVCARLPGQHQYWQFHVAHAEGGIFPEIEGVNQHVEEKEQFDGIAELSFKSPEDRQTWFQAAAILMDDEHNLFSKAIGYNTSSGNSVTYIDGIFNGAPNGKVGVEKFHVLVRKADGVTVEEFRHYLKEIFTPNIIKNSHLLKFRLHLFDEVDNSRPDAAGVSHYESPEKQYQAAFEIAFATRLDLEYFFASTEYQIAVKDQAKHIKHISPFYERTAYDFVYNGELTLAGQRGSTVAELITNIGAVNQLQTDILELLFGKVN